MARKKMNFLDYLAWILLLISALVHGVMAFGINLVEKLISIVWLQKTVYGFVGFAFIYGVYTLIKISKK